MGPSGSKLGKESFPNSQKTKIYSTNINKNTQQLKILGTGEIKIKINIEADLISKSAKEKLEKIGGSILIKKK